MDEMTNEQYEELVTYVCAVTVAYCVQCSDKKHRVTPFHVWGAGRYKARQVSYARALVGLCLRCTVGRPKERLYKFEPAKTPQGKPIRVPLPRPWLVRARGIPIDETWEPFPLTKLGETIGGDHTTFIAAINRLKADNPKLLMDIRENSLTQLEWTMELWHGLEARRVELALLKTNALNAPPVAEQADSQAEDSLGQNAYARSCCCQDAGYPD